MFNRSVALLFVVCLALVCAVPLNSDHREQRIDLASRYGNGRIVGGDIAQPGQFPYQVSFRDVEYGHTCNGAIMAARWVVTAQHCTVPYYNNPENLVIVTAGHDIQSGIEYPIEIFIQYEHFESDTLTNDITMVRTSYPIQFNEQVAVIPVSSDFIGAGFQSRVSGWGSTEYGGPADEFLKFLDFITLSNLDCISRHTDYGVFVTEDNLCAYSMQHGRGTCNYNGGSPLVNNGMLIGLVSFGHPCAVGRPDVFVRVSHFANWINGLIPL